MRKTIHAVSAATAVTKSKNDQVRAALLDHRDDGSDERNIFHYFYPRRTNAVRARELGSELVALGLKLKATSSGGGLVAEEFGEVASSGFDNLTQHFSEIAERSGFEYDGWECEVKQSPSDVLS
ncbi:MAG: ribonuclease E inhibitor RraB [Hyphomicrobiaceae bacterium]|nr:hypothetical protein [Hyphomicrobiaceae bacterium]